MIRREYYSNGKLRSEQEFLDGQRDGPGRSLHVNGKTHYTYSYRAGKMHGIWECWSEDGTSCYRSYWIDHQGATKEEWRIYELIEQLAGI